MDANDYNGFVSNEKEKLLVRSQAGALYDQYYTGRPPLPWLSTKVDAMYAHLMRMSRSNFPLLIVDSVNDRLKVEGFRMDAPEADDFVWRKIWQPNNLDVFSTQTHQHALVHGQAYMSVWPDERIGARVRGESAFEVYHEVDPADPMTVVSAIKIWPDTYRKMWFCRIFTQEKVVFLAQEMNSHANPTHTPSIKDAPSRWQPDPTVEQWEIDNPLMGTVPIVPFVNRPRLDGTGFSEIGDLLDVFDRINTLTGQMLLAGELASFKVKWATGLDIPTDENGNPIESYQTAMDRLWISQDPDTKFGTFDSTPLDGYQAAIDQAIQQAAAISRTPPFLLLGKITNLSAEALQGTTEGLVQKVAQRQTVFGEAWETTMRLALQLHGDSRAEQTDMETIWADARATSEAAKVDALMKLHAIGLPWRAVMERYGASPQEIARWEQQRGEDMLWRSILENTKNPTPIEPPSSGVDGQVA